MDSPRLPAIGGVDRFRFVWGAGHEVGHLTFLISGVRLEEGDLPELQSFVKALRKRWRPVFGIDKRSNKGRER